MAARRDALAAAAEVVLAIQNLGLTKVRVATVGSINATPNVVNVIPSIVQIGVDLRDCDDARLAAAVDALGELCRDVAESTRTAIELRRGTVVSSTPMAPDYMAAIEGIAARSDSLRCGCPQGQATTAKASQTCAQPE